MKIRRKGAEKAMPVVSKKSGNFCIFDVLVYDLIINKSIAFYNNLVI